MRAPRTAACQLINACGLTANASTRLHVCSKTRRGEVSRGGDEGRSASAELRSRRVEVRARDGRDRRGGDERGVVEAALG